MNDLVGELLVSLSVEDPERVTDSVLRLCETRRGGLLAWAMCRKAAPVGNRALTYAYVKSEPDAVDRVCLFESFEHATDPSTLINSLELVKQWSNSDDRIRADASRLILRCLHGDDPLADAALDALSACTEEPVNSRLSGSQELIAALARITWPESFGTQIADARASLASAGGPLRTTDIAEISEALEFLGDSSKSKGEAGRRVLDACRALEHRKDEEEARNQALAQGQALHVLRLGTARSKPDLGTLRWATGAWERLLESVGNFVGTDVTISPVATARGSFKLALAVGSPDNQVGFSEGLGQSLVARSETLDVNRAMLDVLVAAQKSKAFQALIVEPERAVWSHSFQATAAEAATAEKILRPFVPPLTSMEIPQADSLERVLRAVELIAQGNLSVEALGLTTSRQVNYYKQAGRLLGMLDEHNELTSTGRQVLRVTLQDQYTMLASLFEQSKCGEAWIEWAAAKQLPDLTKESAREFLSVRTSGLSNDTVARRAQTLAAWLEVLAPRHYSLLIKK